MNNFLHNVVKSLAVALFVSSQAMAFYVNTSVIAAYTVGRVILQTVHEDVFTYHYDPRGNLVAFSNAVLSAEHDSLGRVARVEEQGGVLNPRPTQYNQSYDLAGNRLVTANGAATYTNNKTTSPGFTHDPAGQATQVSILHYWTQQSIPVPLVWNHENRLYSIHSPIGLILNEYDILGRRVISTSPFLRYVWSGDHVVMDCVLDLSQTPEWSYSWGVGVDNLLACTLNPTALSHVSNPPAPQVFYPIRDRLGSIMGLVDASGVMVAYYDYDAWGGLMRATVPSGSSVLYNFRFRWQCREYVPVIRESTCNTGFYYFRNRWYDPQSGRFISKDPIGLDGGDLNLYVFCGNDPVNNVDPYGLQKNGRIIDSSPKYYMEQMINNGRPYEGQGSYGGGNYRGDSNAYKGLKTASKATITSGVSKAGKTTLRTGANQNDYATGPVDKTNLYRAVKPAELTDIQNTGKFNIVPQSVEGKYFTSSYDNALKYGLMAEKAFGDPPYSIVSTIIQTSLLPKPVFVEAGIPAYVLPPSTLKTLTPSLLLTR